MQRELMSKQLLKAIDEQEYDYDITYGFFPIEKKKYSITNEGPITITLPKGVKRVRLS